MRFVPTSGLPQEVVARVREVYEEGFPPELREPFETLTEDLALVCLDGDPASGSDEKAHLVTPDDVLGFVVLRELAESGWLFVRFLVVAQRGQGTGSRIWRDLVKQFPDVPVIALDVEDPADEGLTEEEVSERERRIAFYDRLGVHLLPVSGYAPPHDGEPLPLLLLAWTRPGTPDVDPRDVVLAVYADRYGLDADDPLVRRTLEASGL